MVVKKGNIKEVERTIEEDALVLSEEEVDWEQSLERSKTQAIGRPIKEIREKRALTPPLVAMVHQNSLVFKPTSDFYTMNLPVKGRSETMQPATVIEGIDVMQGIPIILVCNVMMVSAFDRAKQDGPLTGRYFGLKAGDMIADKAYRVIDVAELEIDFDLTVS